MHREKVQARYESLRAEIQRHAQLYYRDHSPEISDFEYDMLLRELEALEKTLGIADPTSPTHRIGDDRITSFEPHPHRQPMLSLDNAYSQGELLEFDQRLRRALGNPEAPLAYVIEPKIDGVAVSLTYENGQLTRALTRGNGTEGDDITHNVRTIAALPHTLQPPHPVLIELRGEIYIAETDFATINALAQEQGERPYKNPRNLAAGSVKLLDASLARRRRLRLLLYGTGYTEPSDSFDSQQALHAALQRWQLPTHQRVWTAQGIDEAWTCIQEMNTQRTHLPYATDGVVVKLDSLALQQTAGHTSKSPRHAIAYKFAAERASTRVVAITVQVGRTGVLTPVAELQPVEIARTTIARATLHNADEIQRKDIRIGDMVLVEKAGEIIPAVLAVLPEHRPADTAPFDMVAHLNGQCPACAHPISRESDEVAWRCTNPACPPQLSRSIQYFASRKALDIGQLGESLAEALTREQLVKEPLDLFTLDLQQLATLNLGTPEAPHTFGEKNARKLLDATQRARTLPLHRWIFAMGIPHVGHATARELSRLHEDFPALAHSALLQDIERLDQIEQQLKALPATARQKDAPAALRQTREDLKTEEAQICQRLRPYALTPETGKVVARSVRHFFASKAGQHFLERLHTLGIAPKSDHHAPMPATETDAAHPVKGKTFVLTGTLPTLSREAATTLIQQAGGKVSNSVSKHTHYVVFGEEAGSKKDKAQSLGIPLLDETALRRLLEG